MPEEVGIEIDGDEGWLSEESSFYGLFSFACPCGVN